MASARDADPGANPGASQVQDRSCTVCGEHIKRYDCIHYGAQTCYSCRAFFRRYSQASKQQKVARLKCKRPASGSASAAGPCRITLQTRKACKKCRYDRCLAVGMRPDQVLTEEQKMKRFRKFNQKQTEKKPKKAPLRPAPGGKTRTGSSAVAAGPSSMARFGTGGTSVSAHHLLAPSATCPPSTSTTCGGLRRSSKQTALAFARGPVGSSLTSSSMRSTSMESSLTNTATSLPSALIGDPTRSPLTSDPTCSSLATSSVHSPLASGSMHLSVTSGPMDSPVTKGSIHSPLTCGPTYAPFGSGEHSKHFISPVPERLPLPNQDARAATLPNASQGQCFFYRPDATTSKSQFVLLLRSPGHSLESKHDASPHRKSDRNSSSRHGPAAFEIVPSVSLRISCETECDASASTESPHGKLASCINAATAIGETAMLPNHIFRPESGTNLVRENASSQEKSLGKGAESINADYMQFCKELIDLCNTDYTGAGGINNHSTTDNDLCSISPTLSFSVVQSSPDISSFSEQTSTSPGVQMDLLTSVKYAYSISSALVLGSHQGRVAVAQITDLHLGCGDRNGLDLELLSRLHYLVLESFASAVEVFGELAPADKDVLLARGAKTHFAYVLARYLTARSGLEQVRWLLEDAVGEDVDPERLYLVSLEDIASTSVEQSVDLLSGAKRACEEISKLASQIELASDLRVSQSLMALVLLFTSEELSLKDPDKVGRELNNYLALLTAGNQRSMDAIRRIAVVVGSLSDAFETLLGPFNADSIAPRLSMPFTGEEASWLQSRAALFDGAFRSVSFGTDFLRYNVAIVKGLEHDMQWRRHLASITQVTGERTRRILMTHEEFAGLPDGVRNDACRWGAIRMYASILALSDGISHLSNQARAILGTDDLRVWNAWFPDEVCNDLVPRFGFKTYNMAMSTPVHPGIAHDIQSLLERLRPFIADEESFQILTMILLLSAVSVPGMAGQIPGPLMAVKRKYLVAMERRSPDRAGEIFRAIGDMEKLSNLIVLLMS